MIFLLAHWPDNVIKIGHLKREIIVIHLRVEIRAGFCRKSSL